MVYHQLHHQIDVHSTVIRWHTRKLRSNPTEERKRRLFTTRATIPRIRWSSGNLSWPASELLASTSKDNPLRFYQTQGPATRSNVPASVVALRDSFFNTQLQKLHVLKLKQLRFNKKTENPENFLVNLTKKAQRAYPTPDLPAVAPSVPAIIGATAAAEAAGFPDQSRWNNCARLQIRSCVSRKRSKS